MARRESIVENARRQSITYSSGAVNLISLRGGRVPHELDASLVRAPAPGGPRRSARRVARSRGGRPSPLVHVLRQPPGTAEKAPRRRPRARPAKVARFVPDAASRRPPRSSARSLGAPAAPSARRSVGDEVERRELVRPSPPSAPRRLGGAPRARRASASNSPPPPPPSPPRARRRARPRRRVGRVRRRPQRPPQQIPPQVPRLLRRRVRPGGAGAHTGRQGERSSGVPECTTAIVV